MCNKLKMCSLCANPLIHDIVTHHCERCSSAFPGPWLRRRSCCTVGKGRYWGSDGDQCRFPRRPSLAPSVAHCNSTSDGPVGSSRSETRFHKPCRGRCPLGGQGEGQRGHNIRIYTVLSYLCIKIKSSHTCIYTLLFVYSSDSKPVLKGFSTKSSAAAYRCVATTGLVPFLKGKQEHWTICLQKPPC